MPDPLCKVDGCKKKAAQGHKGMCIADYRRDLDERQTEAAKRKLLLEYPPAAMVEALAREFPNGVQPGDYPRFLKSAEFMRLALESL